jgi:hydroxypyruvate isomerase
MPKFAANLSMMFKEKPFLERFGAAAGCGFNAVEFLWPYEYSIGELKEALGGRLTLALFNTRPGDVEKGEWGIAALPGRESEFMDGFDESIEYASKLGCRLVHVMAGVVPAEEERELCLQTFINNVRKAAARAEKYGISLTLEALSPGVKQRYLYKSQYQAMAVRKAIGMSNVFTQLDLFHAQMVDGNLSHLIADFKGAYAHVQIASAPDRHEPDEGEINYPYLFKLLDKIGYSGWVGCEYNPRGKTEDGLGWMKSGS